MYLVMGVSPSSIVFLILRFTILQFNHKFTLLSHHHRLWGRVWWNFPLSFSPSIPLLLFLRCYDFIGLFEWAVRKLYHNGNFSFWKSYCLQYQGSLHSHDFRKGFPWNGVNQYELNWNALLLDWISNVFNASPDRWGKTVRGKIQILVEYFITGKRKHDNMGNNIREKHIDAWEKNVKARNLTMMLIILIALNIEDGVRIWGWNFHRSQHWNSCRMKSHCCWHLIWIWIYGRETDWAQCHLFVLFYMYIIVEIGLRVNYQHSSINYWNINHSLV